MTTRLHVIAQTGIVALALAAPVMAGQDPDPSPRARPVPSRATRNVTMPSDELYEAARRAIDQGQFEPAITQMSAIIERFGRLPAAQAAANRVDAAMYWKAYAEAKQRAVAEALSTVAELQKAFAGSRWVKDAMALALEVQQASGQAVSPDAQPDEDLKLLALRGLMQSDPDRAVPMIEQLLAGSGSVRVKENALFVLSQSRSPRAHQILATVAKGGSNPDLQVRAVRYLGVMSGTENLQVLDEAYRSASDERVKRAVMRSLMLKGDRARLAAIANDAESSIPLRSEAIQQLGRLRAGDELGRLYSRANSPELKRKAIHGLFVARDASTLVALARAEIDPSLKKEIVLKLTGMKSSEATDYLLELLK